MQPREKLKQFIESKGLNNSQFADIVEKPRQYVTNILNGTKNFGLEFVILLGYKFPELDLNWLLKTETDIELAYDIKTKTDIVSEANTNYEKKKYCKECIKKDKLINTYERLCESQGNAIKRLEAELLSIQEKNKKTG